MVKKFTFAIILVLLVTGYVYSADTAIQVDMLVPGIELDGNPISGGKVYTYVSGTTTPKATYLDRNKVATATNPIILDSEGRAEIYADGLYKFVVKDSDDVTIFTMDGVSYGVSDTPQWVYLSQYDSLSAALTAIGVTPTVLVVDTTDTLTASVTVPSTVTLMPVARNAIDVNSKTLTLNSSIWGGPFQWIYGLGTVNGTPIVSEYERVWTASTLTDSTTPTNTMRGGYNVVIHSTYGDYTSMAAYIANTPAANDKVLWDTNETITSKLTLPSNVTIRQATGRVLTIGNTIAGTAVQFGDQTVLDGRFSIHLGLVGGESVGTLVWFNGDSNDAADIYVTGDALAWTVSNLVDIASGKANNKAFLGVTTSGTITTLVKDSSGTNDNYIIAQREGYNVSRSNGANQMSEPTLLVPVIANFSNATHTHTNDATGGNLNIIFNGASMYEVGGSQSVNNGTATSVSLDTVLYDTNSFNSIIANTYTIPSGVSRVKVSGQVCWSGVPTAGYRELSVYKNGAGFAPNAQTISNNVSTGFHGVEQQVVSPVFSVSEGDYIELVAFQNSGSSTSIDSAFCPAASTWFAIERVQ